MRIITPLNTQHHSSTPPLFLLLLWIIFLSLLPVSLSSTSSSLSDIHDLLRSKGLPAGLFPKEVKSYTLSDEGLLEVTLHGPCLTKFENRVFYDTVLRANLSYGSLMGVEGLTQEELFLWLPVKDIIVDDPKSGLILFDIVVAHKQLSLSLFEDPPNCKPQGVLKNNLRKGGGIEALR
ncbi:hypothetical protein PanWU01x14_185930 [Parasponia andersonii]|uniref:Transmembrane protein n=1 Tax=Parasponia andersonii TaxID=3476 RepID=A0A2P5C472_PARAD|nr:hypothetical protein PanWU01x14_185930 [Parasponia andersonii]